MKYQIKNVEKALKKLAKETAKERENGGIYICPVYQHVEARYSTKDIVVTFRMSMHVDDRFGRIFVDNRAWLSPNITEEEAYNILRKKYDDATTGTYYDMNFSKFKNVLEKLSAEKKELLARK
jgi:hypothetical protein